MNPLRRVLPKVLVVSLVCVQAALSTGCSSLLLSGEGTRIRPGYEIPLTEENSKYGTYRTEDLSVQYQYSRAGNAFQFYGTLQFDNSLRYNFNVLRKFHLGLILADGQGNSVGTKGLVSTGHRGLDSALSFSSAFTLPEGTAFMAFTYTGSATEGGGFRWDRDDDGMDTEFWEYPVVK